MVTLLLLIVLMTVVAFSAAMMHAAIVRAGLRVSCVFRHIGLAVAQNLPLSVALRYSAKTERGPTRQVLHRTSLGIKAGLPLSGALKSAYPKCPALPMSIIKAAEDTGTLPSALRELNEHLTKGRLTRDTEAGSRWVLLATVAVVFFISVSYYSLAVMPRMQTMFLDFDLDVPTLSSEVLAATPFAGYSPTTWWGSLYSIAFSLLLLSIPAWCLWSFLRLRPRRSNRIGILAFAADYIRWHLWPWRGLAIAEGLANTLPILRLASAAGWSLPNAIDHACTVEVNELWRTRLRDWGRLIREGAEPVQAGKEAGMPGMLMQHLAIGVRDGCLQAPLCHAEGYYAAMLQRWHRLLANLLWPAATLCMGVMVGTYCLGIVLAIKLLTDIGCTVAE